MYPHSFFCDGLGTFGVGIASSLSERVLVFGSVWMLWVHPKNA